MLNASIQEQLQDELRQIQTDGFWKTERVIASPSGVELVVGGKKVLNFCANNYLGLSNDPRVIADAHQALDRWGYGLASVRFICGTQQVHKDLERAISEFLGTEDTILYSSCFDANTGLFEIIAQEPDVIISDRLNHASIIDGIRLSKAERLLYEHLDMADLEAKLRSVPQARRKIVVTDGVFSMDGDIAPLDHVCAVAKKYEAVVVIDDSHAIGFVGQTGRGTAEHHQVQKDVDLTVGTLSKALGGASGGFTSGRQEIIDLLRQRSRPYLFSSSLVPAIAATSLAVVQHLNDRENTARTRLWENTAYFRKSIARLGLEVRPGTHPIIPIMVREAKKASAMAARLLELGIYVIGFSFPVVPKGQDRIRVQISAAHTREQLDRCLQALSQAAKELGLVGSR